MNIRSYLIRDELNGRRALGFASEIANQTFAGVEAVELSMRYASGLDVTGLAMVVRMYSQLRSSGRGFLLTEVPDHIAARLDELGLSSLISEQPKLSMGWGRAPLHRRAYA